MDLHLIIFVVYLCFYNSLNRITFNFILFYKYPVSHFCFCFKSNGCTVIENLDVGLLSYYNNYVVEVYTQK